MSDADGPTDGRPSFSVIAIALGALAVAALLAITVLIVSEPSGTDVRSEGLDGQDACYQSPPSRLYPTPC